MWNNEKRKSAQLGVKSVNILFIGHEFQFDPRFIPLSNEVTKIEKKRPIGRKICQHENPGSWDSIWSIFRPYIMWNNENRKNAQFGVKSVNI